ncbi:MAG: PUA domain-containing protein [Candidatus Odinarchaeota archaeon]
MSQKKSKKTEVNRKEFKKLLKLLDGIKGRPIDLESLGYKKIFLEIENGFNYYFNDSGMLLFFHGEDEKVFPALKLLRNSPEILANYPKVTLDGGAMTYILNGADVFSPGIREAEIFGVDDVVIVLNDQKSPICVGTALYPNNDLPAKGKAIKSLHYLGDRLWSKTW